MNNRKQKINSLLDSLTQKEINDYIKERNIDKLSKINKFKESLNKISDTKQDTHFHTIGDEIGKELNEGMNKYYKMGQAWMIAFVLECFYDNKYKIKDLQWYLKEIMKQDDTLKEYVYEIMKDF